MATVIPNSFKAKIFGGSNQINWTTDTIKASLHTSALSLDQDTLDYFDDLTNEVASSGSYTAGIGGGIALTNRTATVDNTDNEGVYDADDLAITSFTGTFRYIAIRKDTGVAATSPIIAVIDMGGDNSATASTVTIAWQPEGVFNIN